MEGKAETNQIFLVRTMMERAAVYKIQTHHLFVDFCAVYDSMIQKELYDGMIALGIPLKSVRLVRMTEGYSGRSESFRRHV